MYKYVNSCEHDPEHDHEQDQLVNYRPLIASVDDWFTVAASRLVGSTDKKVRFTWSSMWLLGS